MPPGFLTPRRQRLRDRGNQQHEANLQETEQALAAPSQPGYSMAVECRNIPTMLCTGVLLIACNGRPGAESTSQSTETNTESEETGPGQCDGAALEYGSICYVPTQAANATFRHPVDLDGQPGDELIEFADGKLTVHKWMGESLEKAGDTDIPSAFPFPRVVIGEFDEQPGLDLVVAEPGDWAILYHLDLEGLPEEVDTTPLTGPEPSRAMAGAVAIGPDDDGRWRIVGHYNNSQGDDDVPADRLALWEVVGTQLVDQRLDLPHDACEVGTCIAGDFNGDGRQDALCPLSDVCTNGVEPEDQALHALLLAQPDGSVDISVHPVGAPLPPLLPGDINRDQHSDLVGTDSYRLGQGMGIGPFVSTLDLPTGFAASSSAFVGDFDGDGDDELLLGNGSDGVVFHDRSESTEFDPIGLDGVTFPVSTYLPRVDVNGDGTTDIPLTEGTILVSERRP